MDWVKRTESAARDSAGVLVTACIEEEGRRNTGSTVKLSDSQCRQLGVVGQEDHIPIVLGIVEFDAAKVLRVVLACFDSG